MDEKTLKILDRTLQKLTSARFILTIIGGLVFAYCVWKNKMEAAATTAILTSIFTSYFGRSDRGKNGDNNKT